MHFSLPTILAASSFFITGTSAAPAQDATAKALETRECNFQAHVDSVFNEDGLTRRRVVYSNSGGIDGKELGNLWLAEDALAKCNAIDNNIAIYFHAGLQAWVIDHNQFPGVAGDAAADCLLVRFRDKISRQTGCKDES